MFAFLGLMGPSGLFGGGMEDDGSLGFVGGVWLRVACVLGHSVAEVTSLSG